MAKLQINDNLTRIRCSGMNLVKLINNCSENMLNLENIVRLDYRTIEFSVNDKDFKKLKSLDLNHYDIQVISKGGIHKLLKFIYFRMGLIIGIILSVLLLISIQNRLFHIQISGLGSVTSQEVEQSLHEFGIKKYKYMNFDSLALENFLVEKFDFSFVSVITKGNSLIINVKEELPDVNTDFSNITSPYNMIITKLNVFAGTSRVDVGDIVYLGDVIVEPYEIINNEKISIKACAEIEGEIFFSERYEFKESEDVLERTGKSKIIENTYFMGNLKLLDNQSSHTFENFEIEKINMPISNYFLPINIKKVVAYELTTVTKTRNFEEEKEKIINDLKTKSYAKVPENLVVDSEEIKISSTKYGYIVTIYLKSSVYLKYNIK